MLEHTASSIHNLCLFQTCMILTISLAVANSFFDGETPEGDTALTNTTTAAKHAQNTDDNSKKTIDFRNIRSVIEDSQSYEYLRMIQKYENKNKDCKKGILHNLGDGIIEAYGRMRFVNQALIAVNRANFLTRLWRKSPSEVHITDTFLKVIVRNNVEENPDVYGSGNCYLMNEYIPNDWYCPFAYRTGNGGINVKNMAVEYRFNGSADWFVTGNLSAIRKFKSGNFTIDVSQKRYNSTSLGKFHNDTTILVEYSDGNWTTPYFDCGGAYVWMMTYTVPVFGYKNNSYYFKAFYSIDIDLQKMDINQCPEISGQSVRSIFAGTDRCLKETTRCVPVPGLGFHRGSYKCVCKDGFYFPDPTAKRQFFWGEDIELEYEKARKGTPNNFTDFKCLPCAKGCLTCENSQSCILTLNWLIRTIVLGFACMILSCIPIFFCLTFYYKENTVMKAFNPFLMRLIFTGAFMLYCPQIIGYFEPTVLRCCLLIWFRGLGFVILYGTLLLKIWRLSVVLKAGPNTEIIITDMNLLKRLVIFLIISVVYLSIRTTVSLPTITHGVHVSGLLASECSVNFWNFSDKLLEFLVLLWGVRLCYLVHKAPSQFNDIRFISFAIYNVIWLSVFLNISVIFFRNPFPSNPDLLYIFSCIYTQMTTTVTLGFVLGTKAYHIYKKIERDRSDSIALQQSFYFQDQRLPSITISLASSVTSDEKTDTSEKTTDKQQTVYEVFDDIINQLQALKQQCITLGLIDMQIKLMKIVTLAKRVDFQEENLSPTLAIPNKKDPDIDDDDDQNQSNEDK